MARVFLVNPPSPEPVRSPLLAFCYLASALRRAGHVVGVLDASTPRGPTSHEAIAARLEAFRPDLVGLHLKTLHVQPAYALAAALAPRWKLVAGGPHATVCPDEPLRHGFTYVLRGEAEESLVELAAHVDGQRPVEEVSALTFRGPLGPRRTASRGFLRDLDALAAPIDAVDLFEPAWYGRREPMAPAGLLSSRGCPAACTFCSNNVTGRQFRYRSADDVAREVAAFRDRFGLKSFTFFDDSFAVGRRRVEELCDALERHAPGVYWTCTAHPAHLGRDTLRRMKAAGCTGVDIGMESGDAAMLVRIGKGVTRERVLDVLGWGREEGLHVMLNLMFGWPDETADELRATLDFMQRAAPLASAFNARGVLVPYPGTEIYDQHHERFGFTEWWIREPPIPYEPFPEAWNYDAITRAYATDAALERNFFHHGPEVVELIREALREKSRHTFRALARARTVPTIPAAGAR